MGLGVRLPVAVVVAPAGPHQAQLARQGVQGRHRFGVEVAVVNFQTAQATLLQLLDQVAALRGIGKVGQRGQTAGCPNRGDGCHGPQAIAGHIRGPAAGQQTPHRVVHRRGVAGRHQTAGDLRPAERRTRHRAGLGKIPLHLCVNRAAKLAQAVHDPAEAAHAIAALALKGRFEGVVVDVHAQAQDVQLPLP